MTRIDFYTNVLDKNAQLLSLLKPALEKRHQVTLMAENEEDANSWSNSIWQTSQVDFLPNVLATNALADQTQIVIDWQEKNLNQDDILINLTQRQLVCFSRFRQMIELVGCDEAEKVAARSRFKFYRDRGYDIKHHELSM